MLKIKSIIFVCTGNTCRSVMAEALFKHYWFSANRSRPLVISSAGIAAFPGDGASPEVQKLLWEEESIDISYHSAALLTGEMVEKAHKIFVMSAGHKNAAARLHPPAAQKIKLLKEFVAPESAGYDISDPFGGNLQIYRETLQEIKGLVLKLIENLERGANNS